jgi:hypothetical protein
VLAQEPGLVLEPVLELELEPVLELVLGLVLHRQRYLESTPRPVIQPVLNTLFSWYTLLSRYYLFRTNSSLPHQYHPLLGKLFTFPRLRHLVDNQLNTYLVICQ